MHVVVMLKMASVCTKTVASNQAQARSERSRYNIGVEFSTATTVLDHQKKHLGSCAPPKGI
jgi:hypothetical protein